MVVFASIDEREPDSAKLIERVYRLYDCEIYANVKSVKQRAQNRIVSVNNARQSFQSVGRF